MLAKSQKKSQNLAEKKKLQKWVVGGGRKMEAQNKQKTGTDFRKPIKNILKGYPRVKNTF